MDLLLPLRRAVVPRRCSGGVAGVVGGCAFARVRVADAPLALSAPRRFGTYSDLVQLAGVRRPPTLLKMDVESAEWGVLPSIVSSMGSKMPLEIVMELHLYPGCATTQP